MSFLEYLFFKYYNWQIKVGNGDMPSFMAVFFISFSFTLYAADIMMEYFFFLSPNDGFINNKYIFIIIFVLLFFVLYFFLVTKEKDIVIIEKHKQEWMGKNQLGAVLFPVIAFAVMIIEVFIKIQMNRGVF